MSKPQQTERPILYEMPCAPVIEARQLLPLLRTGVETADSIRLLIGDTTPYRKRVRAFFDRLLILEAAGGVDLSEPNVRHRHGTRGQYQNGCRCEACVRASRLYNQDYNARRKLRTEEPLEEVCAQAPTSD
jgi:hypothetical protein